MGVLFRSFLYYYKVGNLNGYNIFLIILYVISLY